MIDMELRLAREHCAVTIRETDFFGADLASARLVTPIGLDTAKNFDQAVNLDRLLHD